MAGKLRDRWLPIGWSILLHVGIVAALGWGLWHFEREPPPPQPLAIEATVVDARSLPAEMRSPARAQRVREEQQRQESERRAQLEREAREQAERQARAEEAQRRAEAEAEQRAAAKRAEAERQAEARRREEAERRAREEAERAAAERAAAERAAAARAAAEARQRAEREAREAELRRGLEAEERARAAAASGLRAQWEAQIKARIQRAWIQPPSARPGIECVLHMTQVPGGEVVNVRIGECNGDAAVRQSIEAAAYRASPLPPPPDPALFERNLEVRFHPRVEAG